MWRKLFVPVTPTRLDAVLGLIGGIGCAVIAAVNAVLGYWWFALCFAVLAVGPLWNAWRYFRRVRGETIVKDGESR
jgi:membrane protein implicated in regulation of membrane protease activity